MRIVEWAGWKMTGARNRLEDRLWELRLGVETGGRVESAAADANRYETFAYRSIHRILARLELGADDVVADLGCGKGRIVCCAALRGARKVVGVDLDPWLCERARSNVQVLRGRRASVEIVAAPAQDYDFRECTALLMFNPFGAATLERVLEGLARSLRERPRELRIAYINPVHEALLAARPGFARSDRWERAPWSGLKQSVSFWRAPA